MAVILPIKDCCSNNLKLILNKNKQNYLKYSDLGPGMIGMIHWHDTEVIKLCPLHPEVPSGQKVASVSQDTGETNSSGGSRRGVQAPLIFGTKPRPTGLTCQDTKMCGSRKYPYPPTEGRWNFRGGGGVKERNFRGKGGLMLNFYPGGVKRNNCS